MTRGSEQPSLPEYWGHSNDSLMVSGLKSPENTKKYV